ncbi:hypothetical protein [Thermotalea metallivorans]|uniref:Uncharacterized protein n=1 Tax=Thermotalea metallivorans TaxID=520762 RepID=A0A140L0U3_9FIRM|nr:hypothetical protein [Thermotalea metallivorans]KXG74168.1 hypothetical protein AN619_25870 [Thermotalea metallivorans]
MLIKIMFLITICIPVGYLQVYLLKDAVKDLKSARKTKKPAEISYDREDYFEKKYLRLVK